MVIQYIGYGSSSTKKTASEESFMTIDTIALLDTKFLQSVIGNGVFQRCTAKSWFISKDIDDTLAEWIRTGCEKTLVVFPNSGSVFDVVEKAKEIGLEENKDFFTVIKDTDEESEMAIAFRPMEEDQVKELFN